MSTKNQTFKNSTHVILTRECNFGINVKVSNVKFNKRKKSFSFDTEILSNPYDREIYGGLIQDEILERIIESLV